MISVFYRIEKFMPSVFRTLLKRIRSGLSRIDKPWFHLFLSHFPVTLLTEDDRKKLEGLPRVDVTLFDSQFAFANRIRQAVEDTRNSSRI